MRIIESVVGLMVGLVGVLFYVSFYNSANTSGLNDTTVLILGAIPTFLGIAMLVDSIRSILGGKGIGGKRKGI